MFSLYYIIYYLLVLQLLILFILLLPYLPKIIKVQVAKIVISGFKLPVYLILMLYSFLCYSKQSRRFQCLILPSPSTLSHIFLSCCFSRYQYDHEQKNQKKEKKSKRKKRKLIFSSFFVQINLALFSW